MVVDFHSGRPPGLVNKAQGLHNYPMTRTLILAGLTCLALSACGTTDEPRALSSAPGAYGGPGEAQLRADIATFIAKRSGPAHSQYEYSITDLNGDGNREALVLFNLPYGYWCSWSGCTMQIFTADGDSFVPMSEVRNVRGPLLVAENTTNGWHDIVVRVSGTGMADKNVALQYDNGAYPENPAGLTDLTMLMTDIPGRRIFP